MQKKRQGQPWTGWLQTRGGPAKRGHTEDTGHFTGPFEAKSGLGLWSPTPVSTKEVKVNDGIPIGHPAMDWPPTTARRRRPSPLAPRPGT